MSSFEVELETYETGELVIAEVEFQHHEDSDWCAHGEHGSWVDTSYREIIKVTYSKDGQKYEPTKEDLKSWKEIIESEMNEQEAA